MSTAHVAATGGEDSDPPISTFAGTGEAGFSGDEGLAVSAELNHPYGVAVDSTGTLYFSEYSNHRVRKVTADGKISTFAGTGEADYGDDDGLAVSARLNYPRGVAVDSADAVYIADAGNHRVRKVTANGEISTFAGTGAAGAGGDGGLATAAELDRPYGVAVDGTGAVYIADHNNHRVRKVAVDGTISTFAGTGEADFGGDGGAAESAQLNGPHAVAVDSAGVVYIADAENHRVRKVAVDGTISTFAGTGEADFGGDGGAAESAQLNHPVAVAVDSADCVHICDQYNHRVRKVAADGTISTVAGTGEADFGGDDDPAGSAQLNNPFGLALNGVDALYIADHINNRIRKIASPRLPKSGTVVCWANARSRLRMAVTRESTKDGAEIHQTLPVPRGHQRWRLVVVGQNDGEALYRIENVRSGKALEVVGGQEWPGAVIAQRAYEGDDAHHQQWRLIPAGSAADAPHVYEIANRNSGLYLRADTNARTAIRQDGAEGDHQGRQWQLLPA
ncbi:RICIN domain-containing protein [Streptomyces decoyicus]|uniref:NHL domain-containing protein n=2 Tax=Streptomyces decoyicus TaxID=249567 RepID=UPI001CA4503D|nr:RICIN domain-containing protein [Streptomyces decoyicus]QZY21026.1 RICIN domain-containing protein [Streptomyces decoyicus]